MIAAKELLSRMVRIPSASGQESELADFVGQLAAQHKLHVRRVGGSIVLSPHPGPVRVLFASHLDTVPVGEGWTADPLAGEWRAGRLLGRGANDAKGCAAAMLWALVHCAREGSATGAAVALTACEETSNAGMQAVIDELGLPELAVVGEPTGLQVVRSQAGLCLIEAHWTGSSCHAAHAHRHSHENALLAAARDLAALPPVGVLRTGHPLLGPTTWVPTLLSSGERHNVVPDRACAVFDCRLAPPHSALTCLEELGRKLPGAELVVRSDRLRAVETSAEHYLVRGACELAGAAQAVGSNTMSDMALLADVPAIKVGPGESARSHTADEYLEEEELEAGCRFYRALLPALTHTAIAVRG